MLINRPPWVSNFGQKRGSRDMRHVTACRDFQLETVYPIKTTCAPSSSTAPQTLALLNHFNRETQPIDAKMLFFRYVHLGCRQIFIFPSLFLVLTAACTLAKQKTFCPSHLAPIHDGILAWESWGQRRRSGPPPYRFVQAKHERPRMDSGALYCMGTRGAWGVFLWGKREATPGFAPGQTHKHGTSYAVVVIYACSMRSTSPIHEG
jgi:hypothetical protein